MEQSPQALPAVEEQPAATGAREHRRRHRRQETPLHQSRREYSLEGIWLAAVGFGILLIALDPGSARTAFARWLKSVAAGIAPALARAGQGLWAAAAALSLADVAGVILVLGAATVLAWRLRWRLMHSPALTTIRCPRCQGALHRVHRRSLDRVLSWYVPLRRYRCASRQCGWGGVRIVPASDRRG